MRILPVLVLAALLAVSWQPAQAEQKPDIKAEASPVADKGAAQKADPNEPDTSKIMFIQNLRRIGARIYFMGEALGLNSWLVVKDKQLQILYTTPDQRAVVVGALLSAEGANISQQQILTLSSKYPEIADVLRQGQGATVQVAEEKKTDDARENDLPKSEQLFADLEKATRVTFGRTGAPLIYMIMDVHCGYCHEAWKKLEKYVDNGRIRLSMIPINALGPQSEVDAANWLNKKDPLDAWRKNVAGDETVLKIGEQDPDKEKKVFENTQMAAKWQVKKTPYLYYRGKNDKVRLIVGVPQDVDALLGDLKQ